MNDNFNSIIRSLQTELKYVAIFSFFVNLLMLALPIYSLQLFGRVIASSSYHTLINLTLIVIFLLLVQASLDFVRNKLLQQSGLKLEMRSSSLLVNEAIQESARQGGISKQSLLDVREVRTLLLTPSTSAIFDAPWVIVFLIVLFGLHPLLGITASIGAVILSLLAFGVKAAAKLPQDAASKAVIESSMQINDILRHASSLQAMGMANDVAKHWQQGHKQLLGLQWSVADKVSMMLVLTRLTRTLLQVAVIGIGVGLVLNQQLGTGEIIAASIILGRALAPIEQAVGCWKNWESSYQAYQRLKLALKTKAIQPKTSLPAPRGEFLLERVNFVVNRHNKPVLSNINFRLQAGLSLAIIGPSGSGKSTLAKLLMGIVTPTSGMVKLDGACLTQWNADELGRYIGFVSQDVELLSGTVAQNICRFSDADPKDIVDAARLACVHELIIALPNGYETQLGEAGKQISGGQKQRLALARAIFSKPKVLILDEPNSNLDPEGEVALAIVLQYCKEQGITVIMISHRPGFLRQMDWVVCLRDGCIEKAGPKDKFISDIHEISERTENAVQSIDQSVANH
ncbi:type I secretion system permease/ATPase [Shewanella fidelis]|uniref:Type I secretion system permease/ATPase n=1 Tax=Shewanella fidelis TaxID=173509 RepID=A0AAW8NN37_9GAMM|nr:type I secretion system permease/ATPase [Shewanella fidelis]MDR8524618.1 type I secretion system permease/ATPase [Shewanella fidelis]MDW4812093.1 type I secretion system permease/ATPase [Shewanella fidelis]MDW4817452.1 type I secretion system permease/ATPase [Shewanella fidelis]MDW4821519.1 type I secretion system permease/ATPase [Shewanella fidelis]MDW4822700.1 type I secretion system permease/ATPase [Shewanella fidelis]